MGYFVTLHSSISVHNEDLLCFLLTGRCGGLNRFSGKIILPKNKRTAFIIVFGYYKYFVPK